MPSSVAIRYSSIFNIQGDRQLSIKPRVHFTWMRVIHSRCVMNSEHACAKHSTMATFNIITRRSIVKLQLGIGLPHTPWTSHTPTSVCSQCWYVHNQPLHKKGLNFLFYVWPPYQDDQNVVCMACNMIPPFHSTVPFHRSGPWPPNPNTRCTVANQPPTMLQFSFILSAIDLTKSLGQLLQLQLTSYSNFMFLEPHIICSQVHLSTVLKEKVSEVCPSMAADQIKWMVAILQ